MKKLITICLILLLITPSYGTPIRGSVENMIGSYSGDGGSNQDDSIKASLDLAHTDIDAQITYDTDALGLLGLGGVGKVWYVDSNESSGTESGVSWATATDTLDEAIILVLADTGDDGDIILVAAGHAETLTAADAVDVDVAGVKIIGLGVGENRPTFTYTTNGEFVIGADDVEIHNMNFIAGNAVAHAIDVETGSENWVINNCRFAVTTLNTDEFTDCITTTANSDNGRITNCRFEMGAASADAAIQNVGCDFVEISNNFFSGDYATAAIEDKTTASNWLFIKDNIIFNGTVGGTAGLNGVACISLKADTAAVIVDNHLFCDLTEATSIVAADGFLSGNTYNETEGSGTHLEIGKVYTRTMSSVMTGTTDQMYTVAGGDIEIISMFGECTTALVGVGNLSLEIDATAGTDYDNDFSTAVDVSGIGAGDVARFTNVIDEGVLDPTSNVNAGQTLSWFCPPGEIEQTLSSAGNAGVIQWHMTFRPLEEGVTVVAN
jgi:hypothetical protein